MIIDATNKAQRGLAARTAVVRTSDGTKHRYATKIDTDRRMIWERPRVDGRMAPTVTSREYEPGEFKLQCLRSGIERPAEPGVEWPPRSTQPYR